MKHIDQLIYSVCLWLVLGVIFVLGGCGSVEVVRPAEVSPLGDVRVAFDSFANVGYARNRSLPGWETTREVVETTLGLWYEQVQVRQAVVDGTVGDLQRFLRDLPGPEQCDISVVYLGSNQSVGGGWEFVNGDIVYWRDILSAVTLPAHPCRIVVLDSCYAAALRGIPAWQERFATVTLAAAGPTEKTYQFEPVRLKPIDVRKHYPLAWGWAQTYLEPGWNRHISFLGLMWMEAATKTPSPPADTAGWVTFFDACGQNAAIFRQSISHRWGSAVQTFFSFPALSVSEVEK